MLVYRKQSLAMQEFSFSNHFKQITPNQKLFEQIFTILFFLFHFFTPFGLSSPMINSFNEIVKHLYIVHFTEKKKEVLAVKILHKLPLLYKKIILV